MTKHIRCAIYTRKSSEEGLEQSFNSLQAQREACEAYIVSQKHEGWQAVKTHYDDGGFSGGSMERPALQKLLTEIAAGKVDVVVVYKVDRLTRSLLDFSKIIEAFDEKGVSFVSVTQQFDTTSSMGRLTLNVLLSFAQFEREVTGERIRDKLAASKKKGMWMGGFVPLGYKAKDRQLVINPEEAAIVRELFQQYVRLGRVSLLQQYVQERKIVSKTQRSASGATRGGKSYSRGALYHLLKNRIYVGEISHNGAVYPGLHEAIIDRETWDKAAALLAQNNNGNRRRGVPSSGSLLTGILFDSAGNRYTPTHAVKNPKRYRYYTRREALKDAPASTAPARIPADEIEKVVFERLGALLCSNEQLQPILISAGVAPRELKSFLEGAAEIANDNEFGVRCRNILQRVVVSDGEVEIKLVLRSKGIQASEARTSEVGITIQKDFVVDHSTHQIRLVVPDGSTDTKDQASPLLKAIARARLWYAQLVSGEFHNLDQIAATCQCSSEYVSRLFSLSLISPQIVEEMKCDCAYGPPAIDVCCSLPSTWETQILRFQTLADQS